jgi:uncharacterized protein YdeI (YjbR/CyaY-like superfamily)
MDVILFENQGKFRKWLERHHADTAELLLGFHKQRSGKKSISYKEALDEALCFGWIDGVRKSLDEHTYTIRFTPRKPRSNWSAVNIKRAGELVELGLMAEAGLHEFNHRPKASPKYSYENRPQSLSREYEKEFRANARAWGFFSAQAPYYRRTASFWVMSAKKDETQQRRLETLIADSAAGRRLEILTKPKKHPA